MHDFNKVFDAFEGADLFDLGMRFRNEAERFRALAKAVDRGEKMESLTRIYVAPRLKTS